LVPLRLLRALAWLSGTPELGMAGESMSSGLRKMAARAAAAVPFTAGAGLAGELAGIELTGRRPGGSAEAAAAAKVIKARAAAIAARKLVPLPPADLADKLYIAIHGTAIPMVGAETAGRPGKAEDGRAHTREVKLACVFTQTRVDDDGYPVRDPGSSSYLATFAPAAPLGVLMAAEARRRGAEHVRQLIVPATARPGSGTSQPPPSRSPWPGSEPTSGAKPWATAG
jgi:hypothetical protein